MFHSLKIHNSHIIIHAYYRILSCYYFSEPGLRCDAINKITKSELELIPDLDTYILVKKDTKRGISYAYNRYSKVNNKHLKSHDAKQ